MKSSEIECSEKGIPRDEEEEKRVEGLTMTDRETDSRSITTEVDVGHNIVDWMEPPSLPRSVLARNI